MHAQAMNEILNVRVTPEEVEALLDGYEEETQTLDTTYADMIGGYIDGGRVDTTYAGTIGGGGDIDTSAGRAELERTWELDRPPRAVGPTAHSATAL